ncbi:hypothetical protein SAY87_001666 [Trapa incisa]|uniref:Uncharacterized protein n=1 Tax=Trapa incisa TaxID=236973 RepID=A0AAN7JUI3_9MYRT|nr:hypothetical protein SAY87_001666 [Trapa incisa]
MGRLRAASLLLNQIISPNIRPRIFPRPTLKRRPPYPIFPSLRPFSAISSQLAELDPEVRDFAYANVSSITEVQETGSIPIKAFFLSTGIDLKSLQAENLDNVLPPTSRASNYITLEYCDFPSEIAVRLLKNYPSNHFY